MLLHIYPRPKTLGTSSLRTYSRIYKFRGTQIVTPFINTGYSLYETGPSALRSCDPLSSPCRLSWLNCGPPTTSWRNSRQGSMQVKRASSLVYQSLKFAGVYEVHIVLVMYLTQLEKGRILLVNPLVCRHTLEVSSHFQISLSSK